MKKVYVYSIERIDGNGDSFPELLDATSYEEAKEQGEDMFRRLCESDKKGRTFRIYEVTQEEANEWLGIEG